MRREDATKDAGGKIILEQEQYTICSDAAKGKHE